jgi:di/tricarboxylate transporter
MAADTLLVFAILAVTIGLFVSDRLRLDLVALMSLLALLLSGILTPAQALAGFSDPLVLMIAGLFVVSTGLFQTGIAARLGRWLGRVAGTSEVRLIALVMIVTALLSGVMSSTGTVAVMLPVVVTLAWRARISPSRLLIPLTMASLIGGMMTLIGTPPNLVASNQLVAQGLPPFRFFSFTPLGTVMLVLAVVFMTTIGRHWLVPRAPTSPSGDGGDQPSLAELAQQYGLPTNVFRAAVPAGSPLVGVTLQELGWPDRHQVQVLAIDIEPAAVRSHQRPRRQLERSKPLGRSTRVEAGDRLVLLGQREHVEELAGEYGFVAQQVDPHEEGVIPANLGFVEVLPTPRSRWLDQSLAQLGFRDRYGVQVVAVRRDGASITEGLAQLVLRFGDTLLVEGPRKAIEVLRRERLDAVVLADPGAMVAEAPRAERAPVALGVMLAMLVVMTFGWVPNVVAVLVAAVVMVLAGCLTMDDAYRGINWEAIVLIAAILPMATALEVTGGLQLAVDGLMASLGPLGPFAMLAGLFVLTSVASQVISNTATAVLVAPIAFQAATLLEVSPYPLLMTVALAASTAFATPVATPVNTLVLGPGQYRFGDFLRVGVVLQVLVLIATLLLVPVLFPF